MYLCNGFQGTQQLLLQKYVYYTSLFFLAVVGTIQKWLAMATKTFQNGCLTLQILLQLLSTKQLAIATKYKAACYSYQVPSSQSYCYTQLYIAIAMQLQLGSYSLVAIATQCKVAYYSCQVPCSLLQLQSTKPVQDYCLTLQILKQLAMATKELMLLRML